VRALEAPHTGPTYLLREMVFEVGRRRAGQLRWAAIGLGLALPMACAVLTDQWGGRLWLALGFVSHLGGVAAHRWLFFAEAEHVVGLYYGKR
jgi:DMSO reductase anchor subunit